MIIFFTTWSLKSLPLASSAVVLWGVRWQRHPADLCRMIHTPSPPPACLRGGAWPDAFMLPAAPSSAGSWPLGPPGLSAHTLSQWKESLVALFFKSRVPECFDCVEFDFFVGSHQPKEGRCLWCAKKSTCKCKYISSLLLGPHNLALYRGLVCNPRKGVHNLLFWIRITTYMALLETACWELLSGWGEGG